MNRLRLIAAALLVIGAGLFAIGTSVEKSRHHDEQAASGELRASHDEGAESDEHREAEGADAHSGATENKEGKILGVDRESTGLVVVAVLVSLALAAALWKRPSPVVWVVVAVVSLAFAVFDVAEIAHQLDESASGLATLAALVAAAHLSTFGMAAAGRKSARATR